LIIEVCKVFIQIYYSLAIESTNLYFP